MTKLWHKNIPDHDETLSEEQGGVDRVTSKYQIRYSEICLFVETEDVFLFKKRNYKVSSSVDIITNETGRVSSVGNTSAEPIHVWK